MQTSKSSRADLRTVYHPAVSDSFEAALQQMHMPGNTFSQHSQALECSIRQSLM